MARIHDNELVVDQNFADADDAASTSSHATFRRPAFSPYDTHDGFVPLYGGRTPNQFMVSLFAGEVGVRLELMGPSPKRTNDFDSPGSLRKRRSSFALVSSTSVCLDVVFIC